VSDERDACALVSIVRKDGRPAREVLDAVLHGMAALAHRSGLVDGEGDGAGVLTDIPLGLWADALRAAGRDATAVRGGRFAVAHLFIPPSDSDAVIGVWSTASRPSVTVRNGSSEQHNNNYVQVSRLGQPLVNEVVIPRRLKDAFNSIAPTQDSVALPSVRRPSVKVTKEIWSDLM